MSESKLGEAVFSLDYVGPGAEVAEVVTDIKNPEIRMRLVERAMELDADFSAEDFEILDTEIPSALLVKLARYGNVEFGSAEDVTCAIESISDESVRRALYERAYICDVQFTADQLDRMGYEQIDSAHQPTGKKYLSDVAKEQMGCGCLGFLLGFGFLSKLTKKYNGKK